MQLDDPRTKPKETTSANQSQKQEKGEDIPLFSKTNDTSSIEGAYSHRPHYEFFAGKRIQRSVSGVNQHANFTRIANQRQLAHSEYAQNDVAAGALIEQIVKTQFFLDGT